MSAPIYDGVIIGGGPGGSTAGAFLAQAGRRVVLFDKEHFPLFHVGESLLPYNRQVFRELDLLPTLEKASFVKKVGAQFCLVDGSKCVHFLFFRDSGFAKETETIQVERAIFDHSSWRSSSNHAINGTCRPRSARSWPANWRGGGRCAGASLCSLGWSACSESFPSCLESPSRTVLRPTPIRCRPPRSSRPMPIRLDLTVPRQQKSVQHHPGAP